MRKALEAKQIADARQRELKQALDESERKGVRARGRTCVRAQDHRVGGKALQCGGDRRDAAQAAGAKQNRRCQAEGVEVRRSTKVKKGVRARGRTASARKTIASAAKPSNAEVNRSRRRLAKLDRSNRPWKGRTLRSQPQ